MTHETYGNFALASAVLAVALVVADGGFSRLLVRDVARAGPAQGVIVRRLLLARIAWIAIIGGAAFVGWSAGATRASVALFGVFVVVVVAESVAAGFEYGAVGAERPRRVTIGQMLASVCLLAWTGVVAIRPTVPLALAGFAVSAATRLVWQTLAWRSEIRRAPRAPLQFVEAVRASFPYLAIALIGTLYYRIDIVILHARQGAVETAPYAAAYRIVDAALVLGGVAAAAVMPHLSRLHVRDPGRVWVEWVHYVQRTAIVSGAACAVIAATSSWIAGVAFGEDYAQSSGSVLRLLAIGIPFMLLQVINAAVLFTGDDQIQIRLLRMSVVNLSFNVALTWWLAGTRGGEGAAIATSVSEVFTFAYFAWYIYREFGRRAKRDSRAV
jgi:O-antigen/teichoic acid export membrane protein